MSLLLLFRYHSKAASTVGPVTGQTPDSLGQRDTSVSLTANQGSPVSQKIQDTLAALTNQSTASVLK